MDQLHFNRTWLFQHKHHHWVMAFMCLIWSSLCIAQTLKKALDTPIKVSNSNATAHTAWVHDFWVHYSNLGVQLYRFKQTGDTVEEFSFVNSHYGLIPCGGAEPDIQAFYVTIHKNWVFYYHSLCGVSVYEINVDGTFTYFDHLPASQSNYALHPFIAVSDGVVAFSGRVFDTNIIDIYEWNQPNRTFSFASQIEYSNEYDSFNPNLAQIYQNLISVGRGQFFVDITDLKRPKILHLNANGFFQSVFGYTIAFGFSGISTFLNPITKPIRRIDRLDAKNVFNYKSQFLGNKTLAIVRNQENTQTLLVPTEISSNGKIKAAMESQILADGIQSDIQTTPAGKFHASFNDSERFFSISEDNSIQEHEPLILPKNKVVVANDNLVGFRANKIQIQPISRTNLKSEFSFDTEGPIYSVAYHKTGLIALIKNKDILQLVKYDLTDISNPVLIQSAKVGPEIKSVYQLIVAKDSVFVVDFNNGSEVFDAQTLTRIHSPLQQHLASYFYNVAEDLALIWDKKLNEFKILDVNLANGINYIEGWDMLEGSFFHQGYYYMYAPHPTIANQCVFNKAQRIGNTLTLIDTFSAQRCSDPDNVPNTYSRYTQSVVWRDRVFVFYNDVVDIYDLNTLTIVGSQNIILQAKHNHYPPAVVQDHVFVPGHAVSTLYKIQ